MKSFFRNTLYNSFALYLISQVLPGVKVYGGLPTYIFGGLVLTILLVLLRPILNLLAMPLNLITLGMFSFLVNVVIFYLLTVLVVGISITSFTFPGYTYAGFVIPQMHFNTLFAFIFTSFLQSLIFSFISWITKN